MSAIPDYEQMVERFYRGFLGAGDACVDVGAHVGRHMYAMLECTAPSGRVLAFEPIPSLAQTLAADVAQRGLTGRVDVRPIALSDAAGVATFVVAEDAPGFSGLKRRVYDVPTRTREIQVDVDTLDDVLERDGWRSLRYLKLDAEGAEWDILRGARRTIERLRPIVTFEFGEASYGAYGVNPDDVHAMFEASRYHVYDIRGRALDRAAFGQSARHQALWDYVALPDDADADRLLAPLRLAP